MLGTEGKFSRITESDVTKVNTLLQRLTAWWRERQAQRTAQLHARMREAALDALRDTTLDADTRWEAAWLLDNFQDPEVEQTILQVALDHATDDLVAERCGFTLAIFWNGQTDLDVAVLRRLHPVALKAFAEWIEGIKPEWDVMLRDLLRETAPSCDRAM